MNAEVDKIEAPIGLVAQLEKTEEIGVLHLKGYKNSEIATLMNITSVQAKKYVQEYLSIIQQQVDNDPHFLDRVGVNTVASLNQLDEISKEAWETVTIATNEGLVNGRIQALKLALEVATKKAALLQLLGGGTKDNSDSYARTQRAESVNQILSSVIRDIVGDCDRCRERARDMLAQAFNLMEESDVDDDVIDV